MQAAVHTREARPATTVRRKLSAYLALTKPRVIELLLVVTAPTMILAQNGLPNLWLLVATLIGGAMSAGSAGAFNCYIDRDIDRVMKRTQRRPLVTGELTDREALVFAYALGAASIVWLWIFTNWLAALLSLAAILLYVVFYSLILKRRTSQNIVWGGVAGCMPVLIGWAAVTESLSWTPFILFLIIFLWTPPHYWPLSMKYKDDYAAAGVPMLAVVRGRAQVGLQVILYAWATVACSLLLIPVAGMGLVYSTVGGRDRRVVRLRDAPPLQPRDPPRAGVADAGVPRLDRVPVAALPRDRDRPAPAVLSPPAAGRPAAVRGHRPERSRSSWRRRRLMLSSTTGLLAADARRALGRGSSAGALHTWVLAKGPFSTVVIVLASSAGLIAAAPVSMRARRSRLRCRACVRCS